MQNSLVAVPYLDANNEATPQSTEHLGKAALSQQVCDLKGFQTVVLQTKATLIQVGLPFVCAQRSAHVYGVMQGI
jgi:hypothetical protein